MLGWRGWLIIGGIAYALLRAKYPKWYEDLMLRAYAADGTVPPPSEPAALEKYQKAAQVASAVGLPVGWVLEIAGKVQPQDLEKVAKLVANKVVSNGPPADTSDVGLAAYKQAALGV